LEEKQYTITIDGVSVAVDPEVYHCYYYYERKQKTIAEKDRRNHVLSYDSLDTDDYNAEDLFADLTVPSPEELLIRKETITRLRQEIKNLPAADQKLIIALYYENQSQTALGIESGKDQSTISYHHKRILAYLRKKLSQ